VVCTGGLDELAADVFGLGDARHLDDDAVVGLAGRRRSGQGREEEGARGGARGEVDPRLEMAERGGGDPRRWARRRSWRML
jgi:hypothetical protein